MRWFARRLTRTDSNHRNSCWEFFGGSRSRYNLMYKVRRSADGCRRNPRRRLDRRRRARSDAPGFSSVAAVQKSRTSKLCLSRPISSCKARFGRQELSAGRHGWFQTKKNCRRSRRDYPKSAFPFRLPIPASTIGVRRFRQYKQCWH